MNRFKMLVAAMFVLFGGWTSADQLAGTNLGNGLRIERLEFPVILQDTATQTPVSCTVVGYFYYLGTLHNRVLQVAVHGATYNRSYWDFPTINGRSYSYARYMAGRRTWRDPC